MAVWNGWFNTCVLFSVLHQQINCCFILVLANNQNIIMELVAHGGMIFFFLFAHSRFIHACRQRQTPSLFLHTSPPSHTRQECTALWCHRTALLLDFVSLLACIFSGSVERWSSAAALGSLRQRRRARPPSPVSCHPKPRPWPSTALDLGLAPLSHYLQAFKNTPETQRFNPLLRCSHQNWMKKKSLIHLICWLSNCSG